MRQHFYNAHKGQVAYVAHLNHRGRRCRHLSHPIATPKTDIGIRLPLQDGTHKIGSVEVARGFARYNVILHKTMALNLNNKYIYIIKVTKKTTMTVLVTIGVSPFFAQCRNKSKGATKHTAYQRIWSPTGRPASSRPTVSNNAVTASEPRANRIPAPIVSFLMRVFILHYNFKELTIYIICLLLSPSGKMSLTACICIKCV